MRYLFFEWYVVLFTILLYAFIVSERLIAEVEKILLQRFEMLFIGTDDRLGPLIEVVESVVHPANQTRRAKVRLLLSDKGKPFAFTRVGLQQDKTYAESRVGSFRLLIKTDMELLLRKPSKLTRNVPLKVS